MYIEVNEFYIQT